MTIYYWKAATGSDALIRTHQDAIQRLIQRDYFHHDLEKLRVVSSNPIYSFRALCGHNGCGFGLLSATIHCVK